MDILLIVVGILVFGAICYQLGALIEGLRWSDRAYINGRRVLFQGKYYKVRVLPLPPNEQDD